MAQASQVQRAPSPTLALCLAVIGAAAMIYYHQALFIPRVIAVETARGYGNAYFFGDDFYQLWLSSRELMERRIDPYSPQLTQELQVGLYGRTLNPRRPSDPIDQRRFPYPAFADLLFWPASEFPFTEVRVWVVCGLVVLTVATVLIWFRVLDWRPNWCWSGATTLLAVSSYPALEGLYSVQLGLIVGFMIAASFLALRGNRLVLAGFLMALTTVKPQITGLTILFLFFWALHDWRGRRGWCIGFLGTTAVLLGASLAVLPHWITSWVHTAVAYHHYTSPPVVTDVITWHLGPRFEGAATAILTIGSIIFAIAWRNRAATADTPSFWWTVGILFSVTTITILPGPAVYDHLLLLLGVLLVARNYRALTDLSPPSRILLRLGTALLFWPYVAAVTMIVLQVFSEPAHFQSILALSVPFRAAGSLPFAVLALLGWMSRIRPSELS